MPINIFEPSLQVRHPLLDYEKLEIQGTFPRPHEIPTDVFPTYSVIAGVHHDRPVGKVATFTEDNELRVSNSGGSGSSVKPVKMVTDSMDYQIIAFSGVNTTDILSPVTTIYAIHCLWDVQGEETIGISGWVDFALQNSVMGNLQILYRDSVSMLQFGEIIGANRSKYIHFNPPIDAVASGWIGGGGNLQIYVANNTLQPLDIAMLVYHD